MFIPWCPHPSHHTTQWHTKSSKFPFFKSILFTLFHRGLLFEDGGSSLWWCTLLIFLSSPILPQDVGETNERKWCIRLKIEPWINVIKILYFRFLSFKVELARFGFAIFWIENLFIKVNSLNFWIESGLAISIHLEQIEWHWDITSHYLRKGAQHFFPQSRLKRPYSVSMRRCFEDF